jgi:hypothetical protein
MSDRVLRVQIVPGRTWSLDIDISFSTASHGVFRLGPRSGRQILSCCKGKVVRLGFGLFGNSVAFHSAQEKDTELEMVQFVQLFTIYDSRVTIKTAKV